MPELTGSPHQEGKDGTSSGDKDTSTSSPNNQAQESANADQDSPSTVDMSTIGNDGDDDDNDANHGDPNNVNGNTCPSPEHTIPAQPTQPPDSPNLGANPDETDTLHSIMFNQDGGCLSVGTGRGFRVCNVWPFNETFRREFGANIQLGGGGGEDGANGAGDDNGGGGNDGGAPNGNGSDLDGSSSGGGGGVGLCSMLYRTNLLALTSTTPPPINAHSRVTHSMHTAHHTAHNAATAGQLAQVTSPSFPPNKVLIYDDALSRPIGELSFRHRVLSVKLRRDRIVVILRDRIYVYRFSDLSLVDCVGTGRNEAGLCAISLEGATGTTGGGTMNAVGGSGGGDGDNAVMVLACPGVVTGQVRLELYGLRKTSLINAHESPLAALQVTNDGTLLVTASERGTVLRLFETGLVKRGNGVGGSRDATEDTTGKPIREFRRGVERATVTCLSFNLDNSWVACASDHGTVHVFRCWDSDNAESASASSKKKKSKNPAKLLSKVRSTTKKYFMSEEGSVAHVRGIPHPHACAFVPDRERTVAVAGTDELGNGCLLVAEFAAKGSVDSEEMIRQQLLDGQSGTEVNKSGKVRRLGYHRFFRKTSIAHHIPSSQRRQQMQQNGQANGAYYDELRVGDAPPKGESNIDSVARKLDDVVFSDEGSGDDGFDLVDVA